jgi:hypothetical protein
MKKLFLFIVVMLLATINVGAQSFSDSVPGQKQLSFEVYPVPNNNAVFTVSIYNIYQKDVTVFVYNDTGKQVDKETKPVENDKAEIKIDLGIIPDGLYCVFFKVGEKVYLRKIPIKR